MCVCVYMCVYVCMYVYIHTYATDTHMCVYHELDITRDRSDGSVYEGLFQKGKISGQGTMNYGNGDKYAGSWR